MLPFPRQQHSGWGDLLAAVARHAETTIGPALAAASSAAQDGGEALRELRLEVLSTDEELGMATDYSYNLTLAQGRGVVRCPSIYGCMYGLESFAQLLDTPCLRLAVAGQDVRWIAPTAAFFGAPARQKLWLPAAAPYSLPTPPQ